MKAADVMVSRVITVKPDASVQHAARVLVANRISAVLVADESGNLVGIVSEGDLLRRVEMGTQRGGSWWVANLTETIREMLADDFVKSHARRVSDIMTRDVIFAGPETPLAQIVSLLEKHRIKRVPILSDGKLVGIVSRANILETLASIPDTLAIPPTSDDAAIRDHILAELKDQQWIRGDLVDATVDDGIVSLWGIVNSAAEKNAIRVAAEIAPGAKSVNDYLLVQGDRFEP